MHPLKVNAALFHRRCDHLVCQHHGIRAARLLRRRQIVGVFQAELLQGGAAEDRKGRLVAVEKALLVQQHHRIAGRIVERTELHLRAVQCLFRPFAVGDVLEDSRNCFRHSVFPVDMPVSVNPPMIAFCSNDFQLHIKGLTIVYGALHGSLYDGS